MTIYTTTAEDAASFTAATAAEFLPATGPSDGPHTAVPHPMYRDAMAIVVQDWDTDETTYVAV